jgi:O-antigen ligase
MTGGVNPFEFPAARLGIKKDPSKTAFFWLCAFYVVYCARPEDWIPGLKYLPLARITAVLALWGLFNCWGKTKRKPKDLPIESRYLIAMIVLLFIGGALSPVWPGGAISHDIDFSKVYVAWVLTFLLVTDFDRLKRIIFIQASSVAVVAAISIIKGHDKPRLSGALGGMYSNPNDLAFCVVLAIPFCLAFMLSSKKTFPKVMWMVGIIFMLTALLLTASRAGLIDLAVAGTVAMWHFGIRGKRLYLIAGAFVLGAMLMLIAGGKMKERVEELSSGVAKEDIDGSYEARKYLMMKAVEAIEKYPILGIGVNNFQTFSGDWHEVHMSYLQIASEGGIPVLVLYLMFFRRGFKNLKRLRKMKDLDRDEKLFVGALHSSLVGFVTGALFAPVAYQFFSYFAVAYTATLLKILEEKKQNPPVPQTPPRPSLFPEVYVDHARNGAVAPIR